MRLEELTGSWFADPNGGDNVPLYGGLQEFLPQRVRPKSVNHRKRKIDQLRIKSKCQCKSHRKEWYRKKEIHVRYYRYRS